MKRWWLRAGWDPRRPEKGGSLHSVCWFIHLNSTDPKIELTLPKKAAGQSIRLSFPEHGFWSRRLESGAFVQLRSQGQKARPPIPHSRGYTGSVWDGSEPRECETYKHVSESGHAQDTWDKFKYLFSRTASEGKSVVQGLNALSCSENGVIQTQGPKPFKDDLRFPGTRCNDILFNCSLPCSLASIYLSRALSSKLWKAGRKT